MAWFGASAAGEVPLLLGEARDGDRALELSIETAEEDQAERLVEKLTAIRAVIKAAMKPARRSLPQHLPREEVQHLPAPFRMQRNLPSGGDEGKVLPEWRSRYKKHHRSTHGSLCEITQKLFSRRRIPFRCAGEVADDATFLVEDVGDR